MSTYYHIRIPTIVWGPLICLLLNAILLVWISVNRPEYLHDYRLTQNPDSRHYVLLGRNLLLLGQYSRASAEPYVADSFRTPGYPLLAGALDIVGGALLIYLVQALLQALNCAVIFMLTSKLFGKRTAFFASVLCATDVMLAVLNFESMSEALYVFLTSLAAMVLLPRIVADEKSRTASFFLGGLLLGVATHVRPAGLYLPVIYAALTLGIGVYRGRWKKALSEAVVVVVGALLLISPWIVRNQIVFGIPHLTTADAIMLVYFMGAGAYEIHHGVDLPTAQQMIAEEFSLRPLVEMSNHWISSFSPREMDEATRAAVPAVLRKYPLALVTASVLGIMKASVSHNAGELANMLGKTWSTPGLHRLLRFDPAAITRLFANHIGLVAVFIWEVLHAGGVIVLAVSGLWSALRSGERRLPGLSLAILLAFLIATLGVVGLEAYSRYRAPIMPFVYVVAGYALARLCATSWHTATA